MDDTQTVAVLKPGESVLGACHCHSESAKMETVIRITASTTEGVSVSTTEGDPHHNQISSADRSREPPAHPVHCLLTCHLINQAVGGVITQERVSVRRLTRTTKSW